MSWYKESQASYETAFDMETFEDRNIVNERISFFRSVVKTLNKIGRVVFQDARAAKMINYGLANDKTLSSYPKIQDLMFEADGVALDSPWKFSQYCGEAAYQLDLRIKGLEKARRDFTNDKLPKRVKGWVDRHG